MKRTVSTRRMSLLDRGAASGLLLVLAGCTEPLHVAWNDTQSIIEPVSKAPQVSPPHGTLTVYSQRYILYNGDVPEITRRPVAVYTVDGQVAASEQNPFGEGPLHFALSPGHYIVVSQSPGQWRQVQVDVQAERETVVAEAQLDEAPLAASAQPESTTQVVAGRSSKSRVDMPSQ
jgi:hypothetical protein